MTTDPNAFDRLLSRVREGDPDAVAVARDLLPTLHDPEAGELLKVIGEVCYPDDPGRFDSVGDVIARADQKKEND